MTRAPKLTCAALATLLVAGCAGDTSTRTKWNSEVGADLDGGFFGNATFNNTQVQNGDISFLQDMGARFANEVETTVTFDFNKSTLDDAARIVLDRQANFIRQFPELRFSVYGHTDAVGSDSYNLGLGRRRAQNAVAYLVSKGISESRLEALVSLGERQPVVPTLEKERRNRRTVTEVTGLVERHPDVLNGKYAAIIFRDYVDLGAPAPTELSGISGEEVATEQ